MEPWQEKLRGLLGEEPLPETGGTIPPETPVQTARLDIQVDRKGRNGKCATIISGFTIPDGDISVLANRMKKHFGTGGSARGGEILIQGDRRHDVLDFLTAEGMKARII